MTAIPVPPPLKATSFHCPNCGGTLQLKGFAHTLTAVCQFCGAIIDTSSPIFHTLQTAQNWQYIQPGIPLGSRGKLDGIECQVIGFQIRSVTVDGDQYHWREYVLFNPFRGFRYLTEYDGHWNLVRTLPSLPTGGGSWLVLNGQSFRLFQSGEAQTTYVMGEFPWRLNLAEKTYYYDYIFPPAVLSAERTGNENEVTWSLGQYLTGASIWQAFQLKGSPPAPVGIFANQPAPARHPIGSIWKRYFALLVVLVVMAIVLRIALPNKKVFEHSYTFDPHSSGEPSFVTDPFVFPPGPSNARISIHTNLENNWVYLHLALINTDSGATFDFGREVSFYEGSDSDGHWSEGGKNDSVTLSSIPSGKYYMRIEPEMDKSTAAMPINYTIAIERGVVSWGYFIFAAILLGLPPVVTTWRSFGFERRRWQESNFALPNNPRGIT